MEEALTIIRIFESIAKSYDKVTSILSLGLDGLLRRATVMNIKGERILDVGSGTGSLVTELLRIKPNSYVVMLEPTWIFTKILRNKFKDKDVVRGIIEYAPFRDKVFDSVMSAFVLRDVVDITTALRNMYRISSNIAILDFWKPDNPLVLFIELLHVYVMAISASLLFSPRNMKHFLFIPITILRVPKLSVFLSKLKRYKLKKWLFGIFFSLYIDVENH